MRFNRWFILFIILLIGFIFSLLMKAPKHFNWEQTFSRNDLQPFGCALLDSMLAQSLPHGYFLSRNTPYQMEREDTTQRKSIIIIGKNYNIPEADIKSLLDMACRGDHILLAGNSFGYRFADTLHFETQSNYYAASLNMLKHYVATNQAKEVLTWCGDSSVYNPLEFHSYPFLRSSNFELPDSASCQVLVYYEEETTTPGSASSGTEEAKKDNMTEANVKEKRQHPTAIAYNIGKGRIILVSTPLLFTNYGLLENNNHVLLLRLVSLLAKYPVVRTECYTSPVAEEQLSPLRYILSQPPLRWALYTAILGCITFILFTARRKQRAIPVIEMPKDHSLEFIKLIGTLYYQKKDHTDLVRKKFTYFAERLRREAHIELTDEDDADKQAQKIAQKTGMDHETISRFLRLIHPIVKGNRSVTEKEMKELINEMNNITNHLIQP